VQGAHEVMERLWASLTIATTPQCQDHPGAA
jgi:hypothetical protein